MLSAFLAVLLAFESGHPVASPPARWMLVAGRARLIDATRVPITTPLGVDRLVEGPARAEVSGASRASVRWDGVGGVELVGPAAFEWNAGAKGDLVWRLERFSEAYVELRNGRIALEAPGGWHADLASGVALLRTRSSGAFEVSVYAGGPLLLERVDADPRKCARIRLAAGEASVLDVSSAARAIDTPHSEGESRRRPWSNFEWPWQPVAEIETAPPLPPPAPKSEPAPPVAAALPEPVVSAEQRASEALLAQLFADIAERWFERWVNWRDAEGVPSIAIRRAGDLVETPWGARWKN